MTEISSAELTKARGAVLRNAESLLSDSLLLQANGRLARSFATAVLAAEEFGKLAMLVRAFYAVNRNESFDWRRLDKRMRNHQDKLRLFLLIRYINDSNAAVWTRPKDVLVDYLADRAEQRLLDMAKQDGFYVTVGDSFLREPDEAITPEMAGNMRHTTVGTGQFFATGERTDQQRSNLGGIADLYGKIVCLADDLISDPGRVLLPR